MAKPKNRVWCPDCGKPKMLFETANSAKLFIKFNGGQITDDVSKLRVYYCPACCGYHITSHKERAGGYHGTEKLIQAYKDGVDKSKVEPLVNQVYNEFFVKGGHPTSNLSRYIKWNFSNKLTGIERDWLIRKVMEYKRTKGMG